jgi:hypothetical protein
VKFCPSLNVIPTTYVRISVEYKNTYPFCTDISRLTQQSRYRRSDPSRIVLKSYLSTVYLWSQLYICINKGDRLKSKFKHTATCSPAAWQPRHLCYRPAVFFRHLRLIALSFPQGKIQCAVHLSFLEKFWNCVTWDCVIRECLCCESAAVLTVALWENLKVFMLGLPCIFELYE